MRVSPAIDTWIGGNARSLWTALEHLPVQPPMSPIATLSASSAWSARERLNPFPPQASLEAISRITPPKVMQGTVRVRSKLGLTVTVMLMAAALNPYPSPRWRG